MENYCVYCMTPRKGNYCGTCGHKAGDYTPMAHHLLPGTVLLDRYLIGRVLGEGGFGITYIGLDQTSGQKVAIKEYYPTGLVNRNHTATSSVSANMGEAVEPFEKGRSRFLQEAQILAKFAGEPGIVGIQDYFTKNNTAYIVMEYLAGETLRDYLKKHGTMTFDATIRLLSPVFTSLQQVHSQGLIHRDISPDNIMLLKNGQVKLLDFGAARNVTGLDERSLSVMLKPGYAPEEQYRTKGRQGPWTDVYALSATIYRCITGENPEESMNRVFVDELRRPSTMGATITLSQEAALLKGLAVLQKNRYQTVEALVQGLQGLDTPPASPEPPLRLEAASDIPFATQKPIEPPPPASRVVITRDKEPSQQVIKRIPVSPPATPPASLPVPDANIQKAGPAPKPPVSAPAQPGNPAEAPAEAPKKNAKLVLLLIAYPLILLAVFLIALGINARAEESDSIYLAISALGLVPGIIGGLLSFLFFRRCDKNTSVKTCRVLGIITAVVVVILTVLVILLGENYSFYMISIALYAIWAYLLLRQGYAEYKPRKRMHQVCIIVLVAVILAFVITTMVNSLTHITIGDQRISRQATSVSISADQVTLHQLEKLQELKNLESLSLSYCFLDDDVIPYLENLTTLTSLRLTGNSDITDISGLSSLKNLETLSVADTSISDISVVENFPNLSSLDVSGTDIADPMPICKLQNLSYLSMNDMAGLDWDGFYLSSDPWSFSAYSSGITDIAFLAGCGSLSYLDLSDNRISELGPLERLPNMDKLSLANNRITSIQGICNCNTLDLSGNSISDLGPLASCPDLLALYLTGNELTDISPLENCPKISYLYLSDNQITDISVLGKLNLSTLTLSGNQITDISPLATNTIMSRLEIQNNRIADISVLSNMPELAYFCASDNAIRDLSPLLDTKVPELAQQMDLSGNELTDISPLAQFLGMQVLDLSENPVSDISPLASCPELYNLILNETNVSDITCLNGHPELQYISLIRTGVTDVNISLGTDKNKQLYLSYRDSLPRETMIAMKDDGYLFHLYDVPENKLKELRDAGFVLIFTKDETDLVLHPIETATGDDEPAANTKEG